MTILNIVNQTKIFFKTDLGQRIFSGGLWSIGGAIASRALFLLASILIAHFLEKEEYGKLGMIRSTINMFSVFGGFGLGMTATKYIAQKRFQNKQSTGKIIGLTTLFNGFTGFSIALLVFLFAPYLANQINANNIVFEIRISSIILFFSSLSGAQNGILSGFEAFKTIAKNNLFAGLIGVPIQILLAYSLGLKGAIIGLAFNFFLLWVFNFFGVRRHSKFDGIKIKYKGSFSESKILYRFSLPAVMSGLMVSPVMWICNMFLVNQVNGYEEMAVFDAANQWRAAILFIPGALSQLALPLFSSNSESEDNFEKVFKINVLINLAITTILTLIIFAISPLIMKSYGSGFAEGEIILNILAVSTIFISVNNVIGQAIAGKDKMWTGFYFNVCWGAILVATSYITLRLGYGAEGLASCFLFSYLIHTSIQFFYFQKIR